MPQNGPMADEDRRTAPAAARNRDPILDVLRPLLPLSGLVLEVASGTGEHTAISRATCPTWSGNPLTPLSRHAHRSKPGARPRGSPICARRSHST